MRRTAVALFVLALATAGAAAADERASARSKPKADPGVGQCVKRARVDERACLRAAAERCRTGFETGLAGCYGSGAECARGCIATETACRAAPSADQEGCKLACGSDQKVANQRCKVEPDRRRCQDAAKMKALECKQRCATVATPALQQCLRRFDECLAGCVPPGTAN